MDMASACSIFKKAIILQPDNSIDIDCDRLYEVDYRKSPNNPPGGLFNFVRSGGGAY